MNFSERNTIPSTDISYRWDLLGFTKHSENGVFGTNIIPCFTACRFRQFN